MCFLPISAPGCQWVSPTCPASRAETPPDLQPGPASLSYPRSQGAAAHGPILGSPLRCSQVLQAGGFPAGKGLELLHQGLWLSFPGLTPLVLTPCMEPDPHLSLPPILRVPSTLLLLQLQGDSVSHLKCCRWVGWQSWGYRREHPVHPERGRAGRARSVSLGKSWPGPGSAGLRWGLVLRGVRAFGTAFVPGMLSHSEVAFWVSPLEGWGTPLSAWR